MAEGRGQMQLGVMVLVGKRYGSISIMQKVEILRRVICNNYVKCKNTLTSEKNMTPEETQELQKCLEKVSAILLKNTPSEQLKDFGSIELAVRDHVLQEVAPEIGKFFKQQQPNRSRQSQRNPDLHG